LLGHKQNQEPNNRIVSLLGNTQIRQTLNNYEALVIQLFKDTSPEWLASVCID